jgi:hypothetical protein
MVNFRRRILYSFIIFTSGIFLLLGIAVANLSITNMKREINHSYEKELQLVAYALPSMDLESGASLQPFKKTIEGQLTYVTANGDVRATTFEEEPSGMMRSLLHQEDDTERITRNGHVHFVHPLGQPFNGDFIV